MREKNIVVTLDIELGQIMDNLCQHLDSDEVYQFITDLESWYANGDLCVKLRDYFIEQCKENE